jgi:hypothetical protein
MPAELANFNIQNVFLRDRKARLEIVGHGIAIWWPSRPRREFDDLADAAGAWFRTIASSYYLMTGIPLEPGVIGWVEAWDVEIEQAVIGFADPRFAKVSVPRVDDDVNRPMHEAIKLARFLRRRRGELERASHEALAAANDGTAQSFLSAYRALECVRRLYEPLWAKRAAGWSAMYADLGISAKTEHSLLERAARGVRHGDPSGPSDGSSRREPSPKEARGTVDIHADDGRESDREANLAQPVLYGCYTGP